MKMDWGALSVVVIISTFIIFIIFIGATGAFFTPTPNLPGDSLLTEITLPLIAAAVFSFRAGYIVSQSAGNFRSGAFGGAVNALVSLGLLLLVLSLWDRHFSALGGPGLVVWLPLVVIVGALFGMAGAGVRKLIKAPSKTDIR